MIAWTTILFGLLRGIREGAIMHPAGIREHPLFDVYHLVSVLIIVAAVLIALQLIQRFPGWIYCVGLAVLLWQCTEMGYAFSRWYNPFPEHEHINFLDIISINLDGASVYGLHAVRTVTAALLLFIGGRHE